MNETLEDMSPERRDEWAAYGLARVRFDEETKAAEEARAAAHAEWLAKTRRWAGKRGATKRWGKERPPTVKVRMFKGDAEEMANIVRTLRRHGQDVAFAEIVHALLHPQRGPGAEEGKGEGGAIGDDGETLPPLGTMATRAPTPAGGQP